MSALGLKARLALNLALLVLAGLLLQQLVCLITVRQLLIRQELERFLSLAPEILQLAAEDNFAAADAGEGANGSQVVVRMLSAAGVSHALLHKERIELRIDFAPSETPLETALQRLVKNLRPGEAPRFQLEGDSRALFGLEGKRLLVAVAAPQARAPMLGVALPLASAHRKLSHLGKVLSIYVALNTLLFGCVGFFRLNRLTLEPLKKLLRRANEFKEQDLPYFHAGSGDSEYGRLSSALNQMLQHISAEKSKLRTTVLSLEAANAELKRTQQEMVRAEKLASIGRLSSGIAHEIGNPLGIVLGYVELLKESGLGDAERRDCLTRAEKELNRIGRIIRELLDFSRAAPGPGRQPTALNPIVAEVAEMIRHQPFMSQINLRLELCADADTVLAEADGLRQVLLNLVLNAADAIAQRRPPGGGELVIGTQQSLVPDLPGGGRNVLVPGVTLWVHDNGCGMASDQIGSIFDPFYTTKAPGKGTGLGLYVSFMAVQELGGRIRAESQAGSGTVMRVELPLHTAAGAACGAAR
jgi:signal transduction histidine kinase